MADKKISQLSSASTPLAGTEVLPIVQSSTTVKVATDDLTVKNIRSNASTGILQVTGPAAGATRVMTTPNANFTVARTDAAQSLTGDQTFSTGNLVVGTAGKGVDFSANTHAAGMTSELFTWYEEGTWTPVLTCGTPGDLSVSYSSQVGRYTRIGRVVMYNFFIATSAFTHTTASGYVNITGLPFTANATAGTVFYGATAVQGIQKANYTQVSCVVVNNTSYVVLAVSGPASNQNVDNVAITDMPSGGSVILRGAASYIV